MNAQERLRVTEVLGALEDVVDVRCPRCLTCSHWHDTGASVSGTCDFLEGLGAGVKTEFDDFCSEWEEESQPYEY